MLRKIKEYIPNSSGHTSQAYKDYTVPVLFCAGFLAEWSKGFCGKVAQGARS